MDFSLTKSQNYDLQTDVEELIKEAQRLIQNSKATNTIKSYRSDWHHFEDWCYQRQFSSLPANPQTIYLYLVDMMRSGYLNKQGERKSYKAATYHRRIISISQAHETAGYISPAKSKEVRTLFQGICRTIGTHQEGRDPLLIEDLRRMSNLLPDTLQGIRDRAILIVGFSGGFRRSEIVGLDVEDLRFSREGIVINLRRSKTDQTGEGRKVPLPYGSNPHTCAVRCLQEWLETAKIVEGPIFRSINRHGQIKGRLTDKSVAVIIKRTAEKADLDPSRLSGHSLRAGFVTSAKKAGKDEYTIMKQTGHKSLTTLRRYIRDADLFGNNAATDIGL